MREAAKVFSQMLSEMKQPMERAGEAIGMMGRAMAKASTSSPEAAEALMEIVKQHEALLQTYGLTREQALKEEFFFGFDIEIPLTPTSSTGGGTVAP